MKKLFFFGCLDQVGHYFKPDLTETMKREMSDVNPELFKRIDGLYVPNTPRSQGSGQFVTIGSISIIAWHDYTVDTRPGSNSNIIGYGYTGTNLTRVHDMYTDFKRLFPSIYGRQTSFILINNLNVSL